MYAVLEARNIHPHKEGDTSRFERSGGLARARAPALSFFNPEWVEFRAACGVTRLNPIDTPLLAAGKFMCRQAWRKTRWCKSTTS
jgi:hypothetical protein